MRSEGLEPPPAWLKASNAAITPRPRKETGGVRLEQNKQNMIEAPFKNESDPCGIRTRPTRLERPVTSPEVERASSSTYLDRSAIEVALRM